MRIKSVRNIGSTSPIYHCFPINTHKLPQLLTDYPLLSPNIEDGTSIDKHFVHRFYQYAFYIIYIPNNHYYPQLPTKYPLLPLHYEGSIFIDNYFVL